jgi:hypothetical protein
MQNSSAVLRDFITEQLKQNNLSADEQLLRAFDENVRLGEGEMDPANETRSTTIKQEPDGSWAALRTSGFNLLEIAMSDLFSLLLGGGSLAAMDVDAKLKVALATGALINEFSKHLSKDLTEIEAKILFTIYQLQLPDKLFTTAMLQESYLANFGAPLSEEQTRLSLNAFMKKRIITDRGNDTYKCRERLIYEP